ncbi:MAG: DoxX-like family protein [Saprospiraceae bacterium]|nr:DoxX-like family protein [Saprospiraceae bacterium]
MPLHRLLTFAIALVWLVNGLFCKVLNLVPRHEQIVAEILGPVYAAPLTCTIGLLEMGMAVWVLSRWYPRVCALMQIGLVVVMNVLEFFLVPELLLFGKMNSLFALLFVFAVYYNTFVLQSKHAQA